MKVKNASVLYFLTRSLFLGFGFSLLYTSSNKDTFIGAILGTFIGLLFTYIYSYLIKLKNNQTLKDIFKSKLGLITRIMYLIATLIILLYVLVIYKIFVTSFLLVSSPELFVTIPFLILAIFLAFKNLTIIKRIAASLLPISIIIAIITYLSLIGYVETTNYLPILNNNPLNIFKTALIFGGISSLPNILTIHLQNETKSFIKYYLIAAIILIINIIFISGVLGESLINIFRFPEYIVLKLIKLFQFIEKVENILSVIWIFDLFITATMAIYSIKELVPQKNNKISTILILLIMIFIIDNIFAFNYVNELIIYHILPLLSYIIIIPLIVLFFILLKKKNQ